MNGVDERGDFTHSFGILDPLEPLDFLDGPMVSEDPNVFKTHGSPSLLTDITPASNPFLHGHGAQFPMEGCFYLDFLKGAFPKGHFQGFQLFLKALRVDGDNIHTIPQLIQRDPDTYGANVLSWCYALYASRPFVWMLCRVDAFDIVRSILKKNAQGTDFYGAFHPLCVGSRFMLADIYWMKGDHAASFRWTVRALFGVPPESNGPLYDYGKEMIRRFMAEGRANFFADYDAPMDIDRQWGGLNSACLPIRVLMTIMKDLDPSVPRSSDGVNPPYGQVTWQQFSSFVEKISPYFFGDDKITLHEKMIDFFTKFIPLPAHVIWHYDQILYYLDGQIKALQTKTGLPHLRATTYDEIIAHYVQQKQVYMEKKWAHGALVHALMPPPNGLKHF